MLVMILVGVLLGIGMAGIDRADPGARGLQTSVEAFVQSTRDRARSSGQPVVLEYQPVEEERAARLVRYVFRRQIEANFEPAYAETQNVQIAAPANLGKTGRFGAGLDLSLGGGATVLGRGGRLRSPEGLQFEFDFRADELEGAKVLEWKDLASIEVQRNGGLKFSAVYRGEGSTTNLQEVQSDPGLVRKGRWHHVRAIAINGRLALVVDGKLAGEVEAIGQLNDTERPPYLGDPNGRFVGAIDEFVVWGRALELGPSLSGEQEMFLGALKVVFDRFGRLDPAVHEESVEVRIANRGNEVGAFRIGVFTEEVAP